MQDYDVAVIGAGIVGLGVAWQLQRSGRKVVVIDPTPASGASYAAAGMLAPVTEFHYREQALQEMMLASWRLWPEFIDQLPADVGYQRSGTLLLGLDPADRKSVDDLVAAQSLAGLPVQRLDASALDALEPLLGPQARGPGYFAPADHQVDPRRLATTLQQDLELCRARAIGVKPGLVELDQGASIRAPEVIVANGLGAASLQGLPFDLPLRAVHGDILRLDVPEQLQPLLMHTVRAVVRGNSVYLIPRPDGTVVIGATQREDGRAAPSAGGVYQLLRDAQALLPAVAELSLSEVTARARPGTPDNAPLLGRVAEGLTIATGFYRHGVLLMPLAAQICTDLLDGQDDRRWAGFAPARFKKTENPVPIQEAR